MPGELLSSNVNDFGLDYIATDIGDAALVVYITSVAATTYLEAASTFALGNEADITTTGPQAGDVSGRKITIDAIAAGDVTGTGTVTHWALTDGASILIAVGPLAASQMVTTGNTFTLTEIDIEIPAVVVT